MQPLPGPGRGTRLSLLGIGLLVLLSVVAFASRSGLGHRAHTAPSQGYVNYAVTVFLILFVLMIPVAVYAFMLRLRERAVVPRKSFQARMTRVWSEARGDPAGRLRRVLSATPRHRRHPALQPVPARPRPQARTVTLTSGRSPRSSPQFQWTVLWIALVVLAAIAVFLLLPLEGRQARRSCRASSS